MWNVLYLLIIDRCTAREEPSVLALAQKGYSNQHGSSILRFLDRKGSSSREITEKKLNSASVHALFLHFDAVLYALFSITDIQKTLLKAR